MATTDALQVNVGSKVSLWKIIAGFQKLFGNEVNIMVELNPVLGVCSLTYGSLAARWMYVINRFHKEALEDDTSFEYKDHPVFKGILLGRSIIYGALFPLISFVKPHYLNLFFDGFKLPGKRMAPPRIGQTQP